MRRGAKPTKPKVEAQSPVARKSAKNSRVSDLEKGLAAAQDQRAATAEILRVLSRSPTDLQPVFDAIVQSAARLCHAANAAVFRVEGGMLYHPANYGGAPGALAAARARYPRPVGLDTVPGQAILARSSIQIPDVDDPSVTALVREAGHVLGFRSCVAVPMLSAGEAVGAIVVTRRPPGPFSDAEVELLRTFADQAVIAIENVRLFQETDEALERQTATSEILRVISSSPTDTRPVFDTIAANAARLCAARDAQVLQVEGDVLRLVSAYGSPSMPPVRSISRGHAVGRAVIDRQTVHVRDMAQAVAEFPETSAPQHGVQSVLAVPLLRKDVAVGVIRISRTQVQPFTDAQIALLQTFADQAVIAIENARLFSELQARTGELSRSVEQLTALGEVGRAVSSTLDLETVLTTIVSRAVQLTGLEAGAIYEYDETAEVFHLRATQNLPEEFLEIARPLALPKGEGATGRLAVTREPVQIPDIAAPGAYHGRLRDVLLRLGHRALLAVPLISEDHIVGGLVVNRRQTGEFAPDVVDLLRTFATQSALAIQNAKLFREIEEKNRQLEVASQHKSEFLANMSHELRTPLNAVIGFSEVLAERMFGDLNEKQEEYLRDIHASGQHLLSLINDILDLSKIEAGRMVLELTDFDLPTAIENALTLVRERAGRRGIALQQAVDQGLGAIRGDERKVKQVLLNLLSNALKFTPEGGRVEVRAGAVDGMAEISVADTGVGIAPEDQDAVFEEFRQVGTADKKVEGTGLGLTLSRKFIELHGGTIWVQSEVGRGSTFTFTLPLRR
jgi:signal transduction histidine kinase/putative methionine-R-sulfoxide reductase with GAF domain